MKYFLSVFWLVFLPAIIHSQPADWKGSIETQKGVVTIRNSQQGLRRNDEMKPLPLSRQLSIGYYQGPDDYLFTYVRTVAVAKNGDIYALDKECVRVFDKTGKHLFNFGRKGEGPGEFKIGIDMTMDLQGNIYLRDSGIQRVSVFSAAGKFLRSFRPES